MTTYEETNGKQEQERVTSTERTSKNGAQQGNKTGNKVLGATRGISKKSRRSSIP
jgi:hypothetical protein